ncbi:MAG: peptide-N(4)-(N-acetyl-beta-glucosaminyl)asparagine amidase [Candidatus Eremiobacteraeota bacterium]|nr:peptide-N(4)-(N-acetyl-beta-glucosaminyl)asparagine amidase [Candidatus Eremiobacteraeota bacterium]
MHSSLQPLLRIAASAVALPIALNACAHTGGAAGSTNLLPQNSSVSRAAGSAAIRGAAARIQNAALRGPNATRPNAVVGSSNTTTADPPVPRPHETPCTVQLFSNFKFTNFTPPTFSYAPPAACPGPWNKVVFEGNFAVTAGTQFDRTGSVWIAGTNVYFGTTAEPSPDLAPSWHVERDVTDLSAIFYASSTGEVVLGNVVNGTYNGIISGSGKLEFYPVDAKYPAAAVADNVYPLSGGPLGDNQYITSPTQPLTATYTFPSNVQAAYLDVFLQSQGSDEFWYTCFPDDLAGELNNCANTAFREGDVAIDGVAAGVAPIYPWIFTGGIDPYLWRPIPGVETLNFKPYRVDLTPFAAMLSDGLPHTVAVTVFNNGNLFAANGALLVYLDHGSSHVTGGIISNSTALEPTPTVVDGVKIDQNGNASGPLSVRSTHRVAIDGYVNTSTGRIETQIAQSVSFSNVQQIAANTAGTLFDQNIKQDTSVISSTTTTLGSGKRQWVREQKDWPLTLIYAYSANPDGSAVQSTSIRQAKLEQNDAHSSAGAPSHGTLSNTVKTADTINFLATGGYTISNTKSSQTYIENNSMGYCYAKTIASAANVLTEQVGGGC